NLLYSILGTLVSPDGISFSKYGMFLLILTLSNIVGFLIIGILATSSAFITYRFGLDPDNLVNPILSSCADLVTTGLLALSFLIFI
ncbi:MAG: magnesium transporter, partial [Candidatus Heimdallarchaeota archaeon]|nr:magnesium transporter [Candidatus Heimdallarchaeota archaeon]